MEVKRIGLGLTLLAAVATSACMVESETPIGRLGTTAKGGDDRNGPYDIVPGWWKPAPDHDSTWTWGSASGAWPDTPDRVLVVMWGDQRRQSQQGFPSGCRSRREHHRELGTVGLALQPSPPDLHQPLRSRARRLGGRERRERCA